MSRLALLRRGLCALGGMLAAMSFAWGQEGYAGMSELPASFDSYLWTALALVFAWLLWRTPRLRPGDVALGLLFGVLNAFGGVLFAYDSWSGLAQPTLLGLTVLRALGQALPMAAAIACVSRLLLAPPSSSPGALLGPAALWRWAKRHETAALMLLFAACWSPYLIAFYPGTVCWDLGEMVAQFFGQRDMDTWHPVFTTWLIGACVWVGRQAGSDNLGAALYTLLQTALLAYALAQAVRFLRSRRLRLAATAFFALTPLWGGYAQFISKDTLYTSALLLFTLSVLRTLQAGESGARADGRTLAGLLGWGLLSCLLRSNGLYVVLPTALGVVCAAGRGRGRVACMMAGAVAGALLFSQVLIPALGIRDETASGIYSVCFQQTARTLRDHADTVTPEEYAEIDRVLDAQRLAELYEPWISDPVKYTFRQYGQGAQAESEALARYRQTWLSMMKRYPLTYLEAFFAGNLSYYTFMPKLEGETYNNQAGNRLVFETYELGDDPRYLHTTQWAALEPVRTLLAAFARGWRRIPILQMLYACASYVWLLVAAGLALWRCRRWRMLAGFLPALLTLGVCMLSPVNDYFRYFLPIVAMTPPLLAVARRPSQPAQGAA